jgi:Restriction Enzyme Adenine Methylase Associated
LGQNLLTRSLHPDCYERNPSFLRAIQAFDLPFKPFPDAFDSAAIESRQALYQRLCEIIWDPAQYGLQVPATASQPARERGRVHFDVSLRQLVEQGALPTGSQLVGSHRNIEYKAELTVSGRIRIESGEEFEAASPAAMAVLEKQSWNGWMFWHVVNADGSLTRLDDVRKRVIEQDAPDM